MFDITLRRALASLAVVTGLLVAAGPAAAHEAVASQHPSDREELTRTGPSADGIIAVLIGLNHAATSTGFTPPIGTEQGFLTRWPAPALSADGARRRRTP